MYSIQNKLLCYINPNKARLSRSNFHNNSPGIKDKNTKEYHRDCIILILW